MRERGAAGLVQRYAGARCRIGGPAEEFWELPGERYRALHAVSPEQWSTARFRGLRFYPWTDPLAYLWGRGARQRIAEEDLFATEGTEVRA